MGEIQESNLFCTEAASFDDEKSSITSNKTSISMGFPSESEEIMLEMMSKEIEHLPRYDYLNRLITGDLDFNLRTQALDWIWKACEELQFGPLCLCLAMNYLDRFLSLHDLPSGKAWIVQLLAVACLSLAAKIEETETPDLMNLQVGDPRFTFEAKSIQRMELMILNILKWRLRAVTPCSYIRYFLSKINGCDQEPLVSKSLQVIASTTKGIDFLEFKSSEIAAAVALSVSGQFHTIHFENSSLSSPFFSHLNKERVKKICEMIEKSGAISCLQTLNGNLQFKTHHSLSLSTTTSTSLSSSFTSLF